MPSALVLIANGTEVHGISAALSAWMTSHRGVLRVCLCAESRRSQALKHFSYRKLLERLIVHFPGLRGRSVLAPGVKILADQHLDDITDFDLYDALVIPGGALGAKTISQNERIQQIVRGFYGQPGKLVGMVCAGSLAAKTSGIKNVALTSHPSVQEEFEEGFDYREDSVVVHRNLITSRGPGTSFDFAFKLVELLCGKDRVGVTRKPMVFAETKTFASSL